MEAKLKHLEFIQGVINRLASDSFRMKGWSVVLIAALFVLMARQGNIGLAPIGLLPVLAFWSLDGYFLWRERLFRALYDRVRTQDTAAIDFSMNVASFRDGWKRSWLGATFSRTLLLFHGALLGALGLFVLFDHLGG